MPSVRGRSSARRLMPCREPPRLQDLRAPHLLAARRAPCRRIGRRRRRNPAAASAAREHARRRDARAAAIAAAPPARDRRHTSKPSPRGAPAPCRCCSSPCRGGCAARASAAKGEARAGPARPCETPTSRPGIRRLCASRVARKPACGPPKPSGTPKRCAEPTAMSAPNSPGGRSSVSASKSAATIDQRAGRVRLLRRSARSRAPRRSYRDTAAARRRAFSPRQIERRFVADSPRSPSGSARVCTTCDRLRMAAARDEDAFAASASLQIACAMCIASAAAVASSSSEAFAMSSPVRSVIIVWKLMQRLQPALRNLRLVRRVGGVPAGILEDVPLDDRRRDAVVVALAEVVFEDLILRRDRAQLGQRLVLAARRRAESSGLRSRMPAGTAASISASSDGSSSVASIAAISRSFEPRWRRGKVSAERKVREVGRGSRRERVVHRGRLESGFRVNQAAISPAMRPAASQRIHSRPSRPR